MPFTRSLMIWPPGVFVPQTCRSNHYNHSHPKSSPASITRLASKGSVAWQWWTNTEHHFFVFVLRCFCNGRSWKNFFPDQAEIPEISSAHFWNTSAWADCYETLVVNISLWTVFISLDPPIVESLNIWNENLGQGCLSCLQQMVWSSGQQLQYASRSEKDPLRKMHATGRSTASSAISSCWRASTVRPVVLLHIRLDSQKLFSAGVDTLKLKTESNMIAKRKYFKKNQPADCLDGPQGRGPHFRHGQAKELHLLT